MKIPTRLVLACLFVLTVFGCNDRTIDPVANGGTSDDTHSSIFLTGRVFDGQSKPIGAVIARLRHQAIADTTDGDGRYVLKGELHAATRSLGVLDTLDLTRNGVLVHSMAVSAWVDTMPDVFLVQRDISGEILSGSVPVADVVAFLWSTRGDTLRLQVEWNPVSRRYSGFAWSRFTGGVDTFFVQVRAMDSAGGIEGISSQIRFTSNSGDIAIPSFSMGNAIPHVEIRGPKVLTRGQLAALKVLVTDSLELPIEVEWKIEDGEWRIGGNDTALAIPENQREAPVVIRVRLRRQDGVVVTDSLVLDVDGLEPWAYLERDESPVLALEPFPIHFQDSASGGGRIVRRRIGDPWNVDVATLDTTLRAPGTFEPFRVYYTVTDDRGSSATDTILVSPQESFLPGLQTSPDSEWFRFTWGKMSPTYGVRNVEFGLEMTDSTEGWGGFRFMGTAMHSEYSGIVGDSLRYSVYRQSAAKSVRVDLSLSEPNGSGGQVVKDSSFRLDLPPLFWQFEGPEGRGLYGLVDNSILVGNPILAGWSGGMEEASFVFDPVFQSQALRILYNAKSTSYGAQSYAGHSQVCGHVTGWKDVAGVDMDLRGTPTTGWLWLDTFFGDEYLAASGTEQAKPAAFDVLRAQGITLGWPVAIDSAGGTTRFEIDSLRWSDGVVRSNPSVEEILGRTVSFKMNLEGGPGAIIIDNVRFENR